VRQQDEALESAVAREAALKADISASMDELAGQSPVASVQIDELVLIASDFPGVRNELGAVKKELAAKVTECDTIGQNLTDAVAERQTLHQTHIQMKTEHESRCYATTICQPFVSPHPTLFALLVVHGVNGYILSRTSINRPFPH
jgi:hypothetical protein